MPTQVIIAATHADAVNVANILGSILAGSELNEREEGSEQETTIQADETLNAIVARADPGVMAEILDIIDKLDVRRAQVFNRSGYC